ncbi:MAG: SemiSWEET transporter [Methanomassiliicoccales archaeon]|jgi:MtN3 and saliva related transmembrane protein
MEDWIVLGLMAGLLTTIGYLPQILKGYRTRRMEDVSIMMPALLCVGMGLWLLYGVVLGDIPIIFWNAMGVSLNIVLIAMKLRFERAPKQPTGR